MQNQTSPLILSFGPSDPVGAGGIEADLATFAALSCHGLTVATAQLIGDSARVEQVEPVEPDWLCDQARVLLEDMAAAAIKVGALCGVEQVGAIAEIISDYPQLPLVLDPFMSALPAQGVAGDDLATALCQLLVPQATLLMLAPAELARLAETWREPGGADSLEDDVRHLLELGCAGVLLTGTRAAGDGLRGDGRRGNTLYGADGACAHYPWQPLAGPFLGAGATLSGAIAALLAQPGCDLAQALPAAHAYTAGALAHARRFGMGKLVPDRFFHLRGAPGGLPDARALIAAFSITP